MHPPSLTPALRIVRGCLHLLVAVLLVLVCVRAATEPSRTGSGLAAVLAASAVFAAVYGAGPFVPGVTRSHRVAALWLSVLGLVWLALLATTADGVWLAFPLFFVQLHLLPVRWGVPAVVLTTAAAIGGFAWNQPGLTTGVVLGPALGAAVAVATVLGYQALYRESEQRRRLLDELTTARHDLAAAERATGMLAERERLAREIHDTLAQGLSSIQLLLRAAERALDSGAPVARDHIERARLAAVDNLAEARRFVHDWSPPDLETGSLTEALLRLCRSTATHSGLAVNCHVSGDAIDLPTGTETALWRIAQSALANTVSHARATTAEVTLSYMGTEVALDVVDDGVGFDPDPGRTGSPGGDGTPGTGFGLAVMRARARSVGGTLVVESAPGRGTAVAVTVPVTPEWAPESEAVTK